MSKLSIGLECWSRMFKSDVGVRMSASNVDIEYQRRMSEFNVGVRS